MAIGVSTDIYLDANATTRVLPAAVDEAKAAMEELFGNPSSSHITGIRARHILEATRSLVRSVLGAESGQIIFTSGATEAIQMGVFSALVKAQERRRRGMTDERLLLYSATEHKAVPQALSHWNHMLGIGNKILEIPVDSSGRLKLGFLREHAGAADIICTMAVNNETGVINDLNEIEQVVRECNEDVPWLVDCVQAVGKMPLNLSATSVDYASISGHKLHAPKGIGVLYVRDNTTLTPLFAGGGQESGARSGTENLPGVAALAAVLRCLNTEEEDTFKDSQTLAAFRDRLVNSLKVALPSVVFNTPFDNAVPTTINFSVKGFPSKEIMDLFDAAGIRVSSGSACGSSLRGSYVLDAMGLPRWRSEGAIRISFGLMSTESEIAAACAQIEEAGNALRESCLIVPDKVPVHPNASEDGLIQLKSGSMCSWILVDSKTNCCVIIDPIEELSERVENFVRCQNCRVLAVIDTHLHLDHVSYRTMLLSRLNDRVVNSGQSVDALGWPETCGGTTVLGDDSNAEYLRFSSDEILVRTELPGHTVDGHCYLVGRLSAEGGLRPENIRFAFSGDTLLIGGIGRTDFPSSSASSLYDSLRKLHQILDKNTPICPTHDYTNGFATTLEAEQRGNPLLAQVLDPIAPMPIGQFEEAKRRLDSKIDEEKHEELVCGLIQTNLEQQSSIDIAPEERRQFFAGHRNSRIIDVREPHEFKFSQDWAAVGLDESPENVPLTRLADFLQGVLANPAAPSSRDFIFICRSGNRSSIAAEVLRRVGVENAWHIAGGLALGSRPNGVSADSADIDFMI